ARAREHSADAALLERHGRRTTQRSGGELEKSGSTATAGIGPLMRSRSFAKLSRFCPDPIGKMAPQAGLEPATLRLTAGCSAIELLRNRCAQAAEQKPHSTEIG